MDGMLPEHGYHTIIELSIEAQGVRGGSAN